MTRRTKIVATIGPACNDEATLVELIEAGADVLRLNFAHATHEQHAATIERVRLAAQKAGREVGLLGDLPGPKLRIGDIAGDVVELDSGSEFTLTTKPTLGDAHGASVTWSGLAAALDAGDTVYLADGSIRLKVLESSGDEVRCEVEIGGALSSHKGLNLPGVDVDLPAVDESDMSWIDFSVEHGIDLLAVSFVRSAADLEPVQARLKQLEVDIPVIAKIEKPQAAQGENAVEIVRAAGGGIMVARGDLGIEMPIASVPLLQKRLLKLAGRHSKPAITATQMLASMVTSPRPTRAEVTDVANAIYDGTDAVMLSEETAVGRNPVEAVKVMAEIARETEPDLPYGEWLLGRTSNDEHEIASSVTQGAVGAVYRLGLAAIVVPTSSGRTARMVSAHRPRVPVLAVSPRIETVRRLNLLFGVRSVLAEQWSGLRDLLAECAMLAEREGVARSGELIAITAGLPEQELGTNLFEVHRVP
ncbi:MAG: pyruvate kinase [Solirubrobacterales bacterium]|nr:pyruvate kinase [Solirubrobacterales bacterium]